MIQIEGHNVWFEYPNIVNEGDCISLIVDDSLQVWQAIEDKQKIDLKIELLDIWLNSEGITLGQGTEEFIKENIDYLE